MIAALRTTLALVLAVLACWCGATPGAAAAAPRGLPAEDCETLDLTDAAAVREHADAVTDVFLGEVRSVRARPPARRQDRDDQVRRYEHGVVVRKTFQGGLKFRDEVRVVTRPSTDDGGFGRLTVGRRYLFFASPDGAALVATCDSGTQALMKGLSAELESAIEDALTEHTEEMPEVTLTAPDDGAGDSPSLTRLAAPGAALALIGVLGLLLLVRVGTTRP